MVNFKKISIFFLLLPVSTALCGDFPSATYCLKRVEKHHQDMKRETEVNLRKKIADKIYLSSDFGGLMVTVDLEKEELPYAPAMVKELKKLGYKSGFSNDLLIINWEHPKEINDK